jgi:hypothetical protein
MSSPFTNRLLAVTLGCGCLLSGGCGFTQPTDSPRGVLELTAPRGEQEWESLWDDLASDDAARGYRALCRLALHPQESVPFLRNRLHPASPEDSREVARLIAALDADSFQEREQAQKRLATRGGVALFAVDRALKGQPSPEARRRLEELAEQLEQTIPPPEELRAVRAVDALERMGTDEARALLADLATGAPDAPLTREAKASLGRLVR